jgi:hypothetical protein
MAGSSGRLRAAAMDTGGEGKQRRAAADSSGNRVNAIPSMILARVWPWRKRARRGMRLGARVGGAGAELGRIVAARSRGASARNRTCGKAGKKGKGGW